MVQTPRSALLPQGSSARHLILQEKQLCISSKARPISAPSARSSVKLDLELTEPDLEGRRGALLRARDEGADLEDPLVGAAGCTVSLIGEDPADLAERDFLASITTAAAVHPGALAILVALADDLDGDAVRGTGDRGRV